MAKRRQKSTSYFPVKIDVQTLSGGVGRSTPSKRLPTEAENLDNIIVSLEHSAEKRRGLTLTKWKDADEGTSGDERVPGRLSEITDTIGGEASSDKDLWFHWFRVSVKALYLIAVDYNAVYTIENDILISTLWWVFKINENGELEQQAVDQPDEEMWDYITHGNGTSTAQESLRAVAVGSSILVLNTQVKAGFTSDPTTDGSSGSLLYKMDGTVHDNLEDKQGPGVEYLTSITVDPEGDAEAWTEWSQFIAGDKAIDLEDRKNDTELNNNIYPADPGAGTTYDYLRKGIWEVHEDISGIVGPDISGATQRRPSHGIDKNVLNVETQYGIDKDFLSHTHFQGGTVNKKAVDTFKFMNNGGHVAADDAAAAICAGMGDHSAFRVTWYADQPVVGVDADDNGLMDPGDGMGWAVVRVAFDLSADKGTTEIRKDSITGTIWDPEADVMTDASNIFIVISTLDIGTMENLTQSVVAGINKGFDQGVTHCRAEVDSALTGFTVEIQYYENQWVKSYEEDEDGEPTEERRFTDFIKASDYYYPNPEEKFLGQAVSKLSDLRFPPTLADFAAFNGGDGVEEMLAELYPGEGHLSTEDLDDNGELDDATGRGKIYYLSQSYLGLSEGHYRVTSIDDLPYLTKIRTPEMMSIIDKRRMPKQITIGGTTNWTMRNVEWDVRKSGSIKTNPGPSIFHDGDGNAVQRQITAISFYRGRLFLASEDILVSSRITNWDDFWVENPEVITVSDPVDLRVSSNDYTPITYLQPYRNFLFMATDGSTQYELMGSENQISPLTAEIAPTSFFSMARDVPPVLLNNSLFFLDKKKLYIYFGEKSESTQNSMEISVNVPEYLPENYRTVAVSPVTEGFFMVDADNPNHIYCYKNRIGGDQILQNAYYRFILSDGISVKSLEAVDDLLYVVWEDTVSDGGDSWTTVNTGYIDLKNEELLEPRMDNLLLLAPADITNLAFDGTDTTFRIKSGSTDMTKIMLWDPDGASANNVTGVLHNITVEVLSDETLAPLGWVEVKTVLPADDTSVTSIDLTGELTSKGCYLGKPYLSTIELSPIYYRDTEQNAMNGSLSLRMGQIRFRNSGDFDVFVTRKQRTATEDKFIIDVADMRAVDLSYQPYRDQGIFKVPILGFSHDISMTISSDSVYPLAISDLEFRAKFKDKLANLGSM